MIMIRRDILKHILLIITILFILFIFINSMFSAEASAEQSGSVLEFVKLILLKFNLNINVNEYFIRKSAHFIEYSILGILLISTEIGYTDNILKHIINPIFVGLLIPVIDESIQLFSDGRSAQVSDILLDFSGVLFGVFIMGVVYFIFLRKKRHRFFKYRKRY